MQRPEVIDSVATIDLRGNALKWYQTTNLQSVLQGRPVELLLESSSTRDGPSDAEVKQVKMQALQAKKSGDKAKATALLRKAKEMEAAQSPPTPSPLAPAPAPPPDLHEYWERATS